MVLGVFLLTLPFIFFGEDIVLIVFGEQYHSAGQLLPLMLFAMIFILPNAILTQGLIVINKEIFFAKLVILVALLNIVLNILF